MNKNSFRAVLVLAVMACAPLARAQISGFSAADAVSRENRLRAESIIADSVDAGTGAFLLERNVLTVQGKRELAFDLAYNSLLAASQGALGRAWSHPYEASIDGDPNGVVTVRWDASRKNIFRFVAAGSNYEPLDLAVTYDRLRRNSDGSWHLDLLDGTICEFNSSGRLTQLGNKVRQFIELGYDSNNRLTSLREPGANRLVFLNYYTDGSGLFQYLQDAADRVVFFDYDSQQRLRTIRNPVTLGSAQGPSLSNADIPDNNPQGATVNVEVTQTAQVGLVRFHTTIINHSRPSDLRVTLISPQGTRVVVPHSERDRLPLDLTNITMDDFEGENPAGTWRLLVVDELAGVIGSIAAFRLIFTEPTDPFRLTYNASHQITQITGPDGERILANTYDAQGRVVEQDEGVDTNQPVRLSYAETAQRLVTTYTDRVGAAMTVEHDARYNLVRTTDPLGHTDSVEYDSRGNRIRITDALGRTTQFSYDSTGNLATVTDPAGDTTIYQHDNSNNLTRVEDPLGQVTEFQYNVDNNLRRVTDAICRTQSGCDGDTKNYNASSQVTNSLLEDGAGIDLTYTSGMATSATHAATGSSGSQGAAYDNVGRATRLTDGDGHSLTFLYNTQNEVIERTDQLGNVTRTEYDRRGRKVREVDARGGVTQYQYDANGNVVAATDKLGNTTRFEYDGEDRLVRTIDAAGNVTAYAYDAAGRMVTETDALGNRIRHEYNAVDNEIAVYNANNAAEETVVYDSRDLPISKKDARGKETQFQYDKGKRLTRKTDPLGRGQTYQYDSTDRQTGSEDALQREASRSYMSDDVTQRLEDPRGNAVDFGYDPANRIDRITAPGGQTTRFSYNNRDLVTDIRYPSGRRLQLGYDNAGLVSQVVRSVSGTIETTVRFTYDENGNVTKVDTQAPGESQRRRNIDRVYDGLDRVNTFTDVHGDTLRYVYDAVGNLTELAYPDGKRVRYGYDAARRLTTVTDWSNRVTTIGYDRNGRITSIAFPNNTSRLMEYDDAGQVTRRLDLGAQGDVIADFRYTYDAAGQMTLETAGAPRPRFVPQAVTMTYNALDNRLATFNGQAVQYDNDGLVTNGPVGSQFGSIVHNAAGNLVQARQGLYAYDAEDRLASFTDSSGRTSRLTVNPEPELSQVLVKTDSTGSVTRYVWGVGLLYEEVNGQIRVNHYDHRGSTIAFSGPTGQVVGRIAYGPFGQIGDRTGETDSIFLFGGLFGVLTDPNGFNYMRFRWYSPQMNRFLSPDSEFGDLDDPSSLNPYVYAANNPVTLTDPNGQFWNILVGAVAGAAITAASDLIFTGKLGPPERYAVAAAAGAAIGACFGVCGAVATFAAATGTGFFGGVAAAGTSALIQGKGADAGDILQGGLEGALVGAELGFGAGGAGAAARGAGKAASAAARGAHFSRASSVLTRVPGRPSLAASRAGQVLARPATPALKRLPGRALRPRPAAGRFSGAFRQQAGRAGRFERGAAAARQLPSRGGGRRVRFRDTRVGANQRGLSNLNNGRQANSGQYRHRSQYSADHSRAGRAPENKPNNEMATF